MKLRDSSIADPCGATRAPAVVHLGVIDYLNVRPVYDWLLREGAESVHPDPGWRIATTSGVPATMNAALLAGNVDISNVSSYAFGMHASKWLLIPQLSVAAHGRVDSVLLFSWHADWRALDGKTIAITDQSATSVELVRLLCRERYGIRATFITQPSDLDAMLAQHDAALVIGDSALMERHARRSIAGRGRPYVFDLASEWHDWTGLPFVFAVWAGRAERAEALRDSHVVDLLRTSKRQGMERLSTIAATYAPRLGLSPEVCAAYLRLLDYELTDHDLAGLRLFLERAVPGFSWSDVCLFDG